MMSESLLTGYFLFRTGRVLPSLVPDAAACETGAVMRRIVAAGKCHVSSPCPLHNCAQQGKNE